MFAKDTSALLQEKLKAKSLALPLVLSGRSLRHDIDDVMGMVFSGMKLAVVADHDAGVALGNHVGKALSGRFGASYVSLDGDVSATMERVEEVRRKTARADALVAVASGSVNDICKYAAHLDGKPYAVFATAASMNGYLSANASITVDGYKKTCAAQMPKAVFCDMSVIAAAPARLSISGLGDSLARPTAQVDWLMSHLLLQTPYDSTPFELLLPLEAQLFDSARGIAKGDIASVGLLMESLLLSGLGMTLAGGSYPASQGEHMVAHAFEMILNNGHTRDTLHGEEIGVTALAMAQVQQQLLQRTPALRDPRFDKAVITEHYGSKVAAEAQKAYHAKLDAMERAGLNNDVLKSRWDGAAQAVSAVVLPPSRIAAILEQSGAPDSIEKLGWPRISYDIATATARFLRDRFTFLDLQ